MDLWLHRHSVEFKTTTIIMCVYIILMERGNLVISKNIRGFIDTNFGNSLPP